MELDSFITLSQMSQCIWGDWQKTFITSQETLGLVSTLHINEERAFEKMLSALCEKAGRESVTSLGLIDQPFFRLSASERFILSALHVEKWSYEKIGRILNTSAEEVAERAWKSRLKLTFSDQNHGLQYPTPPHPRSDRCPQYRVENPWTQRLLDDELSHRERLFMQNHLMACQKCRITLSIFRKLYFWVENSVPKFKNSKESQELAQNLKSIWLSGKAHFEQTSDSPLKKDLATLLIRKEWLLPALIFLFLIFKALNADL